MVMVLVPSMQHSGLENTKLHIIAQLRQYGNLSSQDAYQSLLWKDKIRLIEKLFNINDPEIIQEFLLKVS